MKDSVRCEAFYFGAGRAARFCLLYEPVGRAPRGKLLYVPPFAEEMNRCRHPAAVAARKLAHQGWLVLQMDLAGCGDSAGDFAEANWAGWLEDLRHGLTLLERRMSGPLLLWAVRAGALLAADLIEHRYAAANTGMVLWQPVLSGAQHLKQFLRLRRVRESVRHERTPALAGATPLATREPSSMKKSRAESVLDIVSLEHAQRRAQGTNHLLRAEWIAGRTVEVAGYTVSPALAFALDRAVFSVPRDYHGRVVWFDCVRQENESAAAINLQARAMLKHQGLRVHHQIVVETPFWQSMLIESAPRLVESTCKAMEQLG
ncbi:MAG: hypothetical protein RJA24_979 [Pseudomonadota bacterium]